ncbi:MAG: UbiA family prenyltransferase [Bacteroidales bacterium]|nr:UbiA family prenyltransferase [Bacteroidales bacterium]
MKLAQSFRVGEAFLMSGFFMIAAVFAISEWHFDLLLKSILIFLSVFFLILSVYAFNALCGIHHDKFNFRLSALRKIPSDMYFIAFLVFLIISLFLAWLISPQLIIYIISIKIFWVFYSLPVVGLKNFAFSGSILHFVTQVFHFNMVFSVYQDIGTHSILISLFFAFIFAAGHLNHEVIDFEADSSVKLKTTAAVLGIKATVKLSTAVFITAHFFLIPLFLFDYISLYVLLCFLVALLFQLFSLIKYYNHFLSDMNTRMTYRKIYRLLYFFACLCIILIKFAF